MNNARQHAEQLCPRVRGQLAPKPTLSELQSVDRLPSDRIGAVSDAVCRGTGWHAIRLYPAFLNATRHPLLCACGPSSLSLCQVRLPKGPTPPIMQTVAAARTGVVASATVSRCPLSLGRAAPATCSHSKPQPPLVYRLIRCSICVRLCTLPPQAELLLCCLPLVYAAPRDHHAPYREGVLLSIGRSVSPSTRSGYVWRWPEHLSSLGTLAMTAEAAPAGRCWRIDQDINIIYLKCSARCCSAERAPCCPTG